MLVPAPGKLMTPAGTVEPPWPKSSHCTPRFELLLTSISTMMASTCTCARRISSLSMTAISDFMILGGAVMMSALVATSAQMVTLASTLDAPPLEGAGA